jgi:hypothetical protein
LLGGTLDEPDLYHLEVESRLYGTLSVAYDWKLKDYGGINDQTVLTFAGQDGMIGIGVTNPVYNLHIKGTNATDYLLANYNSDLLGSVFVGTNLQVTGDITNKSGTIHMTGNSTFLEMNATGNDAGSRFYDLYSGANKMMLRRKADNGSTVSAYIFTITNDVMQFDSPVKFDAAMTYRSYTNNRVTDITWATTNHNASNTVIGLFTMPTMLQVASITNNLVTVNSIVTATVQSFDAALSNVVVKCAANLITVQGNAPAATNCLIGYQILNP